MKRLVICLTVCALVAGIICAQDVTSVNVVGFKKVNLPTGGRIMCASPFVNIDDGTNTLESVLGKDQMSSSIIPGDCDRVYLWDTEASQYKIYAVFPGYTNLPTYDIPYGWRDLTTAAVWGDAGIANTNPPVPPGVAFWIVRAGGQPSKELTLAGEVIETMTNMLDFVAGRQFVSYPFSTSIKLVDTTLEEHAAHSIIPGDADRIYVWTTNQHYEIFGAFPGYTNLPTYDIPAGWRLLTTVADWNDPAKGLTAYELQMGEGAWYISHSAFTWTETNKYLHSLKQ